MISPPKKVRIYGRVGKLCEILPYLTLFFMSGQAFFFGRLRFGLLTERDGILDTMKLYKASSYMLINFSSIYLSMHPYVLLILPHHLQSSHGFTSSSAPGNTETHAFRPVLSRMFFCDSNSRLRQVDCQVTPQGVVLLQWH